MHELLVSKLYVSNEAINASFDYSASEIDLMIKVIAAVRREKDVSKRLELRLTYTMLTGDMGESGSNYEQIRKAFHGLISKPIEVWYKETNSYFISALINSARIQRNSGVIVVRINPEMLTIITDTRLRYTELEIKSILGLNTKYAKRLYMLACQFKNTTGVRVITFDQLKKQLHTQDKYDLVADFKRRVLEPSIKLINVISEIEISYEINKTGRKIDEFTLLVKYNKIAVEVLGTDNQRKKMTKYGLSEWQISNVCNTLEDTGINRILYDFTLLVNGGKINNPGGYLAKMFDQAGVNMLQKQSTQINLLDSIKYHENQNSK